MNDNRGRGPNNEGQVERKPSRPYENNPGNPVKQQQDNTKQRVNDALNKKK